MKRVKGPVIPWYLIEMHASLERTGPGVELLDDEAEWDAAIDRELEDISSMEYDMELLDDEIAEHFLEDEDSVVMGAIDFSDSSHEDQRGIWLARIDRSSSVRDGVVFYIAVKLRPGGEGGTDVEVRNSRPVHGVRDAVYELLGGPGPRR